MRTWIILVFFCGSLLAEENCRQIDKPQCLTEGIPSGIVNNVDVISGEYVESVPLAFTPGPEPLQLELIINRFHGSQFNYDPHLLYFDSGEYWFDVPGAMFLKFKTSSSKGHWASIQDNPEVTNCSLGTISAKTNKLNTAWTGFQVQLADGSLYSYFFDKTGPNRTGTHYKLPDYFSRPTENRVYFEYEKQGEVWTSWMTKVFAKGEGVKEPYWSVERKRPRPPEKQGSKLSKTYSEFFNLDDGRSVSVWGKIYAECVGKTNGKSKIYAEKYFPELISRPNAPDVRFRYCQVKGTDDHPLSMKWIGDRETKNHYKKKGTDIVDTRVLKQTVGRKLCIEDQQNGVYAIPKTLYEFDYDLEKNRTFVTDGVGRRTVYCYDENNRIYHITHSKYLHQDQDSRYFDPISAVYYQWGEKAKKNTDIDSFLTKATYYGIDGIEKEVKYKYNGYGSILKKTTYGNICEYGSWDERTVENEYGEEKIPLLKRTYEEGFVTYYEYHKKTDLVTKKFTCNRSENIILREFREYNQRGSLISVSIDDGSSSDAADLDNVSERKTTYYRLSDKRPIDYPVEVLEVALNIDTKTEVQIRRTELEYNEHGSVTCRRVFDADNNFAFETKTEYDSNNLPIVEIDALGNRKLYSYNEYLERVEEVGPGYVKNWNYDDLGHCQSESFESEDGMRTSLTHALDVFGRPYRTINEFNLTTDLVQHEYWGESEVLYPSQVTPIGLQRPKKQKFYDTFGNCSKEIDSRGHRKETVYNIFGQPLKITRPSLDEVESFVYDIEGRLIKYIGSNQTRTEYSYDFLGREIEKQVFSSEGELLETSSKTYNNLHLLSETAPDGEVTLYEYDFIGRKVGEVRGERKTTFGYDSLGRLATTSIWISSNDCLTTVQVFDVLDRVIEERKEDASGNVLQKKEFGYDYFGNVTQEISYRDIGIVTTKKNYNAHGKLTSWTDEDGKTGWIHYDICSLINEVDESSPYHVLDQLVYKITTVEASGFQSIEVCDAFERPVILRKLSPFGDLLAEVELIYDLAGNVVERHEKVLYEGECLNVVSTFWEYDSQNRPTYLCEAVGTSDQKSSRTNYNRFGEKSLVIKPDGSCLHYDYNALGLLVELKSESTEIPVHYRWEYDQGRNNTLALNCITKKATCREYNRYHEVVSEVLESQISVKTQYDGMGRSNRFVFPEGKEIHYTYDALYLREVCFDDGGSLYSHRYLEYDLSGHLLSSESPVGKIRMQIDRKGRETSIESQYWSQTDIQYDARDNLLSYKLKDDFGGKKFTFIYDGLNQLTEEDSHTYAFDSLFNRRNKDNTTESYNSLNQLGSCEYCRAGNLIFDGEASYQYDALDRLVTFSLAGETIEYSYDAFNRRISETKGGKTTYFVYQGDHEIGSMSDSQWESFRVLGLGKGAEIGAAVFHQTSLGTTAPIHDSGGNVVTEVYLGRLWNSIVNCVRYTAFGEIQQSYHTPVWGFKSKRHDSGSLIYFGRRYYSSKQGRWLTLDPKGYQEGPNLYAYAYNCPLTLLDLFGLYARPPSFFDQMQYAMDVLHDSYQYCMSTLSAMSFNTNPLFYCYDPITKILNFLAGQPKLAHAPGHAGPGAMTHEGEVVSDTVFIYSGGIANDNKTFSKNVEQLSNSYGGVQVTGVHGGSEGFISDLLVAVGALNDLNSLKQSEILRNEVLEAINQGKKVILHAHSRGALATALMLQGIDDDYHKYIDVYTYGGAAIIPEGKLARCRNFVSSKDWIPFLANPFSYYSKQHHITMLTTEARIWDHSFGGKTYSDMTSLVAQDWMKKR